MVYAIISDIHSDIDSLNKVLAQIKTWNVDKIICTGDMIGYGENAEAVVQEIIKQNIACVNGNHELALFSEEAYTFMNDKAKKAINRNQDQLSENSLDFLHSLPVVLTENNIRFVHGLPPNSVYGYLSHAEKDEIVKLSKKYSEKIAFCGHTHENEIIEIDNKKVKRTKDILFDYKYCLNKSYRYIINIGSVSLSREKDIKASVFAIYESDTFQLRFIKSAL